MTFKQNHQIITILFLLSRQILFFSPQILVVSEPIIFIRLEEDSLFILTIVKQQVNDVFPYLVCRCFDSDHFHS